MYGNVEPTSGQKITAYYIRISFKLTLTSKVWLNHNTRCILLALPSVKSNCVITIEEYLSGGREGCRREETADYRLHRQGYSNSRDYRWSWTLDSGQNRYMNMHTHTHNLTHIQSY